jgi:hypothetical protein
LPIIGDPQLVQNLEASVNRIELVANAECANLVDGGTGVECILLQVFFITLDDLKGIGAREDPKISLLIADATIAFIDSLDLGQLDLIDKRTAMAIAAVGLEILRSVGHVCFGG